MDWPTAVVICVVFGMLFFKKPISSLILRVWEIRYKKFSVGVDAASEKAKELDVAEEPVGTGEHDLRDWLPVIARVSPRLGVEAAWRELEQSCNDAIRIKKGKVKADWVGGRELVTELKDVGFETLRFDLFEELMKLRNYAVQETGFWVSEDAVNEYIKLCVYLGWGVVGEALLDGREGPLVRAGKRFREGA